MFFKKETESETMGQVIPPLYQNTELNLNIESIMTP